MQASQQVSEQAFDFAGFKRAFVNQDVEAWIDYYADDAEWIEYNHDHPSQTPQITRGRQELLAHLQMIKASKLSLTIEDEIIGPERAAFRVWVVLSSGKRIVEHTFIYYAGGRIWKMVDVEAWD
ncbi:MAG: nuclear transport factor 2 family protein [Candidatus Sericytochromatia bacterium]